MKTLVFIFLLTSIAPAQNVGVFAGMQWSDVELKEAIGNLPTIGIEYTFAPASETSGGLFIALTGFQRTKDGVTMLHANPDIGWFLRTDLISGEFQLQAGLGTGISLFYQEASVDGQDAKGVVKRWEPGPDVHLVARWEGVSFLVKYKPHSTDFVRTYHFGGIETSLGFRL